MPRRRAEADAPAPSRPSPSAARCDWGKRRRVPKAWHTQRPGTPYPCNSHLVGREVTLRGDPRPSTVMGCATPLGATALGKRSSKRACEGAMVLRSGFGRFGGIDTPVPTSTVRRGLRRAAERMCPDAPTYGPELRGVVQRVEAEARAARRHPFDLVNELPFPHRIGSSPCCGSSPYSPRRLDALALAWRDSGEEEDFDRLRFSLYRALPRHLRATTAVESSADVAGAIRAVKDHCWAIWLTKAAELDRSSARFSGRVRSVRRTVAAPARRPRDAKAEALFLGRAELASRAQFLRMPDAEQRRLADRILRKYRRPMAAPSSLLAGEALLAAAAAAMAGPARTPPGGGHKKRPTGA